MNFDVIKLLISGDLGWAVYALLAFNLAIAVTLLALITIKLHKNSEDTIFARKIIVKAVVKSVAYAVYIMVWLSALADIVRIIK